MFSFVFQGQRTSGMVFTILKPGTQGIAVCCQILVAFFFFHDILTLYMHIFNKIQIFLSSQVSWLFSRDHIVKLLGGLWHFPMDCLWVGIVNWTILNFMATMKKKDKRKKKKSTKRERKKEKKKRTAFLKRAKGEKKLEKSSCRGKKEKKEKNL